MHEVQVTHEKTPYEIHTLLADIYSKGEIFATVTINDIDTELKIDTGAKCNVMPLKLFEKVKACITIDRSKSVQLIAYGGDSIMTLGLAMLPCTHKGNKYDLAFHIIDREVKTLVGLHDSLNMKLIQLDNEVHEVKENGRAMKDEIMHKYSDLFDDKLGKLPIVYKMKLNPDVPPVVRPPYRIPIAMQDKVKQELDRMVKVEVIAPVTEPAEWVSSMVATKKKDKDEIRICIDPKELYKAILRPHYPMRTIEEVVAKMPNILQLLMQKLGFGSFQWMSNRHGTPHSTPHMEGIGT